MRAQPGIFASGAIEHCYLELDLLPDVRPEALVAALASAAVDEAVVVAVRPELWAQVSGLAVPAASFTAVEGDGFRMPATQHDAWVWVAGAARDVVFDTAAHMTRELSAVASVANELTGWVYHRDRDLTGFVDGTENPSEQEAPAVAADADGTCVVLFQQWRHLTAWNSLSAWEQELVIGRTKLDSTELPEDVMPADSHVARTVLEVEGEELAIYRRNTAYGSPHDHGTVFVGFCATQEPLAVMLDRMAGVGDGCRDALTRWTVPLTGAYYVAPSVEALSELAR